MIRNILIAAKKSLETFSPLARKKYVMGVAAQSVVGALDLFGIIALGFLGSLAISGVQSQNTDSQVSRFLSLIGISDYSFQRQVALLAVFSSFLLISKTYLSFAMSKRMLKFLANQGSELSNSLVEKTVSIEFARKRYIEMESMQYALGIGCTSISVGTLGSFSAAVADFVLLMIITVGLFLLNPIIAVASLMIFGTVGYVLYLYLNKRAKLVGSELAKLQIESNVLLAESLEAYREIFLRSGHEIYISKLANMRKSYFQLTAEQSMFPNVSKYIIEVCLVIGMLAVSTLAFWFQDAPHAFASIAIFLAAGSRVAPAVLRLQQGLIQVIGNSAASDPTLDLIEQTSDIPRKNQKAAVISSCRNEFSPSISFDSVSFKYPNSNNYVLNDVSFEVKKGSFIAIVGPTGAGKSTIADLILGILEPTEGTVLISEVRPSDAVVKWPGAIAYVPQDVYISSRNLIRNICIGINDSEIVLEQVKNALIEAKLLERNQELVDSVVGSVPEFFSGGQKQRIGIARALYSDPDLLVLDEATSSLDGNTESEISEMIHSKRNQKTIVAIAHRLSTIRKADLIIYVANGRIIGQGTFEELRGDLPEFERQVNSMGIQ